MITPLFKCKMLTGIRVLFLFSVTIGEILAECDPNFKQQFFESAYGQDKTKRMVTRVIPVRGCHMKNRIQTCVDETTKNYHHELDAVDWKVFAEAYVKCLLNTVYPENESKDERGNRNIYSNGEKLAHLNSNDIVLRQTYSDVVTKNLEDPSFDSNIVFLSKIDGTDAGVRRTMKHEASASLTDKSTWEKGFRYATRIEGNVNIGIINWSGGFDLTGDDQGEGGEKAETVVRKTNTEIQFNVPATKTVRTLWTAKRKKGTKKFIAKVLVAGWLWVNQTDQIGNIASDHPYSVNEYLIPVGDMAYYFEKFFNRVNSQTLYDPKQGTLATTDVVHTTIQLDEFPKEVASKCETSEIKEEEMFLNQGLRK